MPRQIQLHDIDADGNIVDLSPKNRTIDVTTVEVSQDYNYGESYLKNDETLSDNLTIINKRLSSHVHSADGDEDGVGFVRIAKIHMKSDFKDTGTVCMEVLANGRRS